MAGVNAFDAAGWDDRPDLTPVNRLSLLLTQNPYALNALVQQPGRPLGFSAQAHRSGNIEDRRGMPPLTRQQMQAMQDTADRNARYAQWQEDQYQHQQGNRNANPADEAEWGAVNHQRDRLNPQRQAAPAWAPQQAPNLYPQAPAQPYTPPMRFAR